MSGSEGTTVPRWLRVLCIFVGCLAAGVAVLVDLLGWGGGEGGVGPRQVATGVAGLLMIGVGVYGRPTLLPDLLSPLRRFAEWRVLRVSELALACLWFALLGGLAEMLAHGLQTSLGLRFASFQPHTLWMATLSLVPFLVVVASALTAAGRLVWGFLASGKAVYFALACVVTLNLALNFETELRLLPALLLALGIATQASRTIASRLDRFQRLMRWSTPGLAALAALVGIGWALAGRIGEARAATRLPEPPEAARNVLLLVLDTVRAQNLSLYGYGRETTPHLDRRAAEAIVFERAYATAPWTLPTHASIFTGLQPHDLSTDHLTPLDESPVTLAEVFSSHGYRTAGFVANQFYTGLHTGLARGFDHYDAELYTPRRIFGASQLGRLLLFPDSRGAPTNDFIDRKDAHAINREFLDWVGRTGDRPFFAFLNYFDAHDPYEPPEPFDSLFSSDVPPPAPFDAGSPPRWTERRVQRLKRAYDEAIASLDAGIESLFVALERRGLSDETIVVVTSDHGEEFAEHGTLYHGKSLYDPVLRVPLVILGPGTRSARIEQPVSVRDLAATMLGMAGLDAARLPGNPLTRYWNMEDQVERDTDESGREPESADVTWTSGSRDPEKLILGEVGGASIAGDRAPISRGNMVAAYFGDYHYIVEGDGSEELYDVRADPWEQENLVSDPAHADSLVAFRRTLKPIVELYRTRTNPFWNGSDSSGRSASDFDIGLAETIQPESADR